MLAKNRIFRLLSATFLIATATAAQAVVEEGNFDLGTTGDLYVLCAASEQDPNFVAATYVCRGFMEGAHQYHDAMTASGKMERLTCTPEGTTVAEARTVFVAWGANNKGDTALMSEAPVVGFIRSLHARFPC